MKKQKTDKQRYGFTLPHEIPGVMTGAFAHALETVLVSYPDKLFSDKQSIEALARLHCAIYKHMDSNIPYTNDPTLFETVFIKTYINAYSLAVYMCERLGVYTALSGLPEAKQWEQIYLFAAEQVASQDIERINWETGPQWIMAQKKVHD